MISGDFTGAVLEAGGVANGTPGTPTATGDLSSTDIDNPNDAWTAVGTATASTRGYGTYTLTDAGLWTYTLDNSNADVQARNVGQILSDTFTVFAVDGTSQVVTIIINGTNDAAVVSGATTGSVVEAGGVNNGTPGTPDRDRQSELDRRRRSERRLDGRQLADRQRLRQLHADGGWPLDLHAGQRQSRRAGAQCGRYR